MYLPHVGGMCNRNSASVLDSAVCQTELTAEEQNSQTFRGILSKLIKD